MLVLGVLSFWMLLGVGFFGLRRLIAGSEFETPRVLAPWARPTSRMGCEDCDG